MILARQVHKSFGAVQAVRGVSFEILRGQCVGLLGPNGAGKTTTIRMVTGFYPPTLGNISIDGHDMVEDSMAARRIIGYLPESTPLYPEMRVQDYLDHRARLFGVARSRRKLAIQSASEQCRVADVLRRRVGQLSKGYRQRVGLAAALVHDPRVLVLDEPTSGLDPTQIRETRSLIRTLSQNRTVLVSSHILPEVEKTCDRVIIIAGGRVRADAAPRELIERAAGPGLCTVQACAPTPAERDRVMSVIRSAAVSSEVAAEWSEGQDWTSFTVGPGGDGADVREPILRALVEARVRVREVSRAAPSLEQVFVSLIEQEA
ncbi:MAG: ABC transporter ATP-binding protein [Phycisphaerales bacterium]